MRLVSAFILYLAMSLNSSLADAQQWSPAEREAWAAIEHGWEALRAEDIEGFMDTFHPQFLGWNMSREAPLDLAGERSGTESFLSQYDWVTYSIEPAAIRVVGDEAIVHYRYREVVRERAGGAVHEETGRATQVLKRENGRWRTLTIMSGPVPQ